MGIEPVTLALIGAWCMACWPCLIPCCISLPLLPLPIIIVRNAKNCQPCPKSYSPTTNNAYWHNFSRYIYEVAPNGQLYSVYWTRNGMKWTKLDKEPRVKSA